MNDPFLLWAIGLMALACVLMFLEIFLPSGGIIGLLAGCSVIGALFCFYKHDVALGMVMTVVTLLAIPGVILFGMRIMPNTPIAKFLMLQSPEPAQDPNRSTVAAEHPLLGKTGKAITDLRPVGTCLIDGKRQDCLADGGLIKSGAAVRVVAADGMQIKVREERA